MAFDLDEYIYEEKPKNIQQDTQSKSFDLDEYVNGSNNIQVSKPVQKKATQNPISINGTDNNGVLQTVVNQNANPQGETAITRLNPLQKINYNIQKRFNDEAANKKIAQLHNDEIMHNMASQMVAPKTLDGYVEQNANPHPILSAISGFARDHWHPLESAKNMTRGAVQGFVGGIGSAINNGLHGLKNSALDVVNAGVPLYKNAPQTDIDYVQNEFRNKHPFKSLIPLYNGYVTRSTLANNIREAQKKSITTRSNSTRNKWCDTKNTTYSMVV